PSFLDFFRESGCAWSFCQFIRVDKELNLDESTTSHLLRLLDEYGVRLHSLLTRIALREDVADELLQELFLKLHVADGFAHAPRPERCLFRSAINLAFDWRSRNRRVGTSVPLNGDEASPQPSPPEQAMHREELEQVMSAVERLAPSDREPHARDQRRTSPGHRGQWREGADPFGIGKARRGRLVARMGLVEKPYAGTQQAMRAT
ncbi:MAG TPA: hypothetical protein VND64_30090, partial [Pirellulales bacterium]|nr:hypothetical protein [Pirellulales bacterium]